MDEIWTMVDVEKISIECFGNEMRKKKLDNEQWVK